MLTDEQRANLEKLAVYLEGLPTNYDQFDMAYVIKDCREGDVVSYALRNGGVSSCGTAACALGHGPAAGVFVPGHMIIDRKYVAWSEYARLFGSRIDWGNDWCFGAVWKVVDNHHFGAAARIRYLLAHGEKPDGFAAPAEVWLEDYEPYRIDAASRTEARRAETGTGSVEDEGLTRDAGDAQ